MIGFIRCGINILFWLEHFFIIFIVEFQSFKHQTQNKIFWSLEEPGHFFQSVSFASLSPSLFENLELQLFVELSSLRGIVSRHGSSADESNVLRWMCGSQSPHRCGYSLYFTVTDSSLRLGIYDPNKNCHHTLPSEHVSNKSAMFVLTNWGKKHKSRYQWWLNLKIGQIISHQIVQIIIIVILL